MKKQILLFCFLFFALFTYAQDIKISGVVSSADDGEPLIGATVQVKGNPALGVATDVNGSYIISVPSGSVLQFSYVGHETAEKKADRAGAINIALASESHVLNEVVAIGYGVMKKSDLTGAVTTVDADKLTKTPGGKPRQRLARTGCRRDNQFQLRPTGSRSGSAHPRCRYSQRGFSYICSGRRDCRRHHIP